VQKKGVAAQKAIEGWQVLGKFYKKEEVGGFEK
jgi:hypothetical protein